MVYRTVGTTPWKDLTAEITRSRADTARAFAEMVKAKSDAGEDVDPLELYRTKIDMTGGDPFKAQYIPSGEALKNMARQANSRAAMARTQTSMNTANFAKQQNDFVQELIYDNWDKSPEEISKAFTDLFGPEQGGKFYSQYRDQIPSMLDEANSKKMSEVMQDPRARLIQSEADIERLFPSQSKSPGMRSVLNNVMKENQRARSQEAQAHLMRVISLMPEGISDLGEGSQRQWLTAMGVNADSGLAIIKTMGQAQNSTRTSAVIKDLMSNPAMAEKVYLAAETGNTELLLKTANMAGEAHGVTFSGEDDPNFQRLMKSMNASAAFSDMADYEARRNALLVKQLEAAAAEEKSIKMNYSEARRTGFINGLNIKNKDTRQAVGTLYKDASNYLFGTENTPGAIYASKENVDAFYAYINELGPNSASLNPADLANGFLESGMVTASTKEEHATRVVDRMLFETAGPKPGTNFQTWVTTETDDTAAIVASVQKQLQDIDSSDAPQNVKSQAKASVINSTSTYLSSELNKFRSITSDPRKANNFSNFSADDAEDYANSLTEALNSLRQIDLSPPSIRLQQPGYRSSSSEMTPSNRVTMNPTIDLSQVSTYEEAMRAIANQSDSRSRQATEARIRNRILSDANKVGDRVAQMNQTFGAFNSDANRRAILQNGIASVIENARQEMITKYSSYMSPEEIDAIITQAVIQKQQR